MRHRMEQRCWLSSDEARDAIIRYALSRIQVEFPNDHDEVEVTYAPDGRVLLEWSTEEDFV